MSNGNEKEVDAFRVPVFLQFMPIIELPATDYVGPRDYDKLKAFYAAADEAAEWALRNSFLNRSM